MLCAVEIYTKRLLALKEELFHVSSENGGIYSFMFADLI